MQIGILQFDDAKAWPKVDPRRTSQEKPDCSSSHRSGDKRFGEDLQAGKAAYFLLCSEGNCLSDRAILEIEPAGKRAYQLREQPASPGQHFLTWRKQMVDHILLYRSLYNLYHQF